MRFKSISDISALAKTMMKNKEKIIESIFKSIERNDKVVKGLIHSRKGVIDGNDDNLRHKLDLTMKIVAEQAGELNQLNMILMMYVSGNNFTSDAAKVAMKTGANSSDILRDMFKAKMSGK